MFCEFPTACRVCGTSFLACIPLPVSATAVPDGTSFLCQCPKCGASSGGMIPNFEPHSLVDVCSPDSVKGKII